MKYLCESEQQVHHQANNGWLFMDTKSTIIDLSKVAIDKDGNVLVDDQTIEQLNKVYASSGAAPQSTNRLNCANTGCDNTTNTLNCINRLSCNESSNRWLCDFDSPH
jgi:hypothetical protein